VEIKNQVIARDPRPRRVADKVCAQTRRIDALDGEAQHQSMRPPIREVHVRVEIPLH